MELLETAPDNDFDEMGRDYESRNEAGSSSICIWDAQSGHTLFHTSLNSLMLLFAHVYYSLSCNRSAASRPKQRYGAHIQDFICRRLTGSLLGRSSAEPRQHYVSS